MEWISVEDRLPENDDEVLCWYEYYHWGAEKILPEYGIGYCFDGCWGGEVGNGINARVIAWMSLPEPYEKNDDFGALDTMYSEDELRSIR